MRGPQRGGGSAPRTTTALVCSVENILDTYRSVQQLCQLHRGRIGSKRAVRVHAEAAGARRTTFGGHTTAAQPQTAAIAIADCERRDPAWLLLAPPAADSAA